MATRTVLLACFIHFFSLLWQSLASPIEDCARLSRSLPGLVFRNGTREFAESITSYFYVQARLLPACVVSPRDAEEVALAVDFLSKTGSPFAVRGGGHGSVTGAANVARGITIDMRSIADVYLDHGTATLKVGAGATWDMVYNRLDPHALSVLGGRAAHVGVGGYLTGGGISFFSPQRGFACDYIINVQVVLSNGTIVNANATHATDLFIALKGGSNNFGIVTRFDLRTFRQGDLWGGGIVYPNSTFEKLLGTFTSFKQLESFDPFAEIELSFVYLGSSSTSIATSSLYYAKPVVNATTFMPFMLVEPQLSNTLRISNTSDFAKETLALSTQNQSSVWATTTFTMTSTILSRILPIWQASALAMNRMTTITSSMTFQSIPPPPPRGMPNSLGFHTKSSPEKNLVLCLISIFFEDTKSQEDLELATKDFIRAVDQVAEDEGAEELFTYLNYAAGWQNPLHDYGDEVLNDLRKVAIEYDPAGILQKQMGGFKLS
ncbi:hypothetical protein BDV96DRAFT_494287 [Lophiotrema nucula]|uniref:FAD-binding PCMH-type domain-containing protein n=1 Tax=Lophiotrema nucula TaxID=690887 RepID=A0A6A5Z7B8_9PLEO|nr:hypothetical protein BDV96DRAFT_494287 [Lophiotrema nucula]